MTKLKNRVISIYNRKTSMRLAEEEWTAFDDICHREGLKRKRLLELLDDSKSSDFGLTCYVRLFTVAYMHHLLKPTAFRNRINAENRDVYQTLNMIS